MTNISTIIGFTFFCILNLAAAGNRSPRAILPRPYMHFLRSLLPQPAPYLMCSGLLEPPALSFENKPQNFAAEEGEELTLTCSVLATPQADILWYHGDNLVSEQRASSGELLVNRRVMGTSVIQSSLKIPCVNVNTAGQYRCEARTPCGQHISSTSIVTFGAGKSCPNESVVNEAPYIKFSTVSRIELAGNLVELICRAGGFPKPSIRWTRIGEDGEEVDFKSLRRYGKRQEVLLVKGDAETITETYKCTATNEFGEAQAESTVIYADDG